jgi:DNA-binding MarR family transcriptional regulator
MPDDDNSLLAQELRVAVGRVARRLRRISAEEDAPGSIKFNELLVLVRLERDGAASPSDIARHEQVTSQAIAGLVRNLEARGMVERSAHDSDGRRTLVTITKAGRAAVRSHDQAALDAMVEVLGDYYSSGEIRRLQSVLPLLNRLADLL